MPRFALRRLALASLFLTLTCAGPAAADYLPPYSLFGGQGVTLGISNVTGVVASNADISIQGFSSFGGLVGGGSLVATGLGSQAVGGPVTFNGGVTLGSATVAGPVSSGSTVVVGQGATIGGPIAAAGSVTVQSNSTVNGNIAAGRGVAIQSGATVNGNVGANGSATVFGTVNGNVTYGQGLNVNSGFNSGQIRGTATQGTTSVNPTSYAPIQLATIGNVVAGGSTVTSGGTAAQPLAPGTYGALNLGFFSNLYLTAGNYYFSSFNFSGSSINYLNVGPNSHINIFVAGDVFENTFASTTVNGQAFAQADASLAADVALEALGNITLTGAGNSFGLLYTPTGDISINGNESITGQVLAGGTVYAAGGVTLNYVPAAAPVPEPASLVLLAVGGGLALGVARRRRRRR